MATTAKKFSDTRDELSTMLSQLMSQLDGLRSSWHGAGAQAFDNTRQRWHEDTTRLNRALGETAEAIGKAGNYYTSTDDEAARRANSISTGNIQLPL
jgi:WXG100 family type VII secretion target